MNALRVLHVGKYYPPERGGIETVVENLCRGERPAADSRALVLSKTARTTEETIDGVPVVRVASVVTIGAVSISPLLPLRLARATADVMVLHEPNPMALLAYAMARPRMPLVVWFHSEVIRPRWRYRLFYHPLLEFALRRATRIVVASPPMLEVRPLRPHRLKCAVVPFGLDLTRYKLGLPASARQAPTRLKTADVSTHGRRPVVLFVGRLVPYKGVDVLLRALPGLDAETVIVGDGPCRLSLMAQACDLGIANNVRFLGETTDEELRALYKSCDLFVLPSITRQEAFGMVLLEAMLHGRPVVSTSLQTGSSWVNQHEHTGLVVEPGNPGELHAALARLFADPERCQQLGDAARARVLELFTMEKMCCATVALYQEVVRTPRPVTGIRHLLAGLVKRAFDMSLSGIGLIISAPIWALLALLIKVEDGGQVFYRQERSGRNGVPFHVTKFRSMIPDAEARLGAVQAAEHDPRVTRIGRIMRATAMDELPQLWNIFKGDMSFTGPRALRPGEIEVGGRGVVEKLEDVPGFHERARVRPGLTGIAQIYAPRDVTRRWKFRYDILYVRRQSFWLDLRLIVLSFWITFRGTWEARGSKL